MDTENTTMSKYLCSSQCVFICIHIANKYNMLQNMTLTMTYACAIQYQRYNVSPFIEGIQFKDNILLILLYG